MTVMQGNKAKPLNLSRIKNEIEMDGSTGHKKNLRSSAR